MVNFLDYHQNPSRKKRGNLPKQSNKYNFKNESAFLPLSNFLHTAVSSTAVHLSLAVVGGFQGQALFMYFGLSDSGGFH